MPSRLTESVKNMIREIIRDESFLSIPSEPATVDDLEIGADLLDTLRAHRDSCVGLAANMIGVRKCVIAVADEGEEYVMYNPQIIKKTGAYDTKEGCLSLDGERPTKRYKTIRLRYYDAQFRRRSGFFEGWIAQIIQHEIDHCLGIII